MEDEDAVGVLNGAEAVGDNERGAAGEQAVERFADHQFGFRIDAGGGFVEDQIARIVRQGASEADELALADGKSRASLVDLRGDSLRKLRDVLAETDLIDRMLDLLAGDAGS